MNHIDLFSGIGGFALAARWAGIETKIFCEKDLFCQKVLCKNFPDISFFSDIKEFYWDGEIDLITAGIPCQPFSQAGNKRGKDDERYLWPELLRIISEYSPSFIIIENVPGLLSLGYETICEDLQIQGYNWESFIIPAAAVKSPHRRDRIWIIAYSYSLGSNKRLGDRISGHIQKNFKWDVEEIQSKWPQFVRNSWETFTARDYLQYNTFALRAYDGLSRRLDKDRIKSLGNSIVPQAAYPFMKSIKMIYDEL